MHIDSFTPFGYLQNPYYQCVSSYWDVQSGVLRSDPKIVGFGWVLPFSKRPQWEVSVGLGLQIGTDLLLTRDELSVFDVEAVVHTPFRFVYRIDTGFRAYYADFYLEDRDLLACRLSQDGPPPIDRPAPERGAAADPGAGNTGLVGGPRPVLVARARSSDGGIEATLEADKWQVSRPPHPKCKTPPIELLYAGSAAAVPQARAEEWLVVFEPGSLARLRLAGGEHPVAVADWPAPIAVRATNGRACGPSPVPIAAGGRQAAAQATRTAAVKFVSSVPRLTGDFPPEVKRGFYYDFETTRTCTVPPAGVFGGHWPTWMINMPRVVLAEGSMDMARLAYADPELAKESILTMLRDTPLENTPCVFASGEFNMVATDGTRCGTSPAWCIPFINIYDVYRRVGDTAWLDAVYPHLVALVDYWLDQRTDPEGWLTYKCTWEAGEDNNPRIDPKATGDNVISDYVRPVELQASMAHAAAILIELSAILGKSEDGKRFASLQNEFFKKTQSLWDPAAQRFRDWDRLNGAFVEVAGEESYWGADFTRQSPLSLIALLLDTATPEQREAMRPEVAAFFRSPFTIWPSWSTFVLEAAAAIDMFETAGEMSWEIVRRTSATSDRRSIKEVGGSVERPMPGASPEYWPYDPKEFLGNDAYAWGAQSAAFIVRHILGIRPVYGISRRNDDSTAARTDGAVGDSGQELGLRLRPAFSQWLRRRGEYGVENLAHGEGRISVAYTRNAGSWTCRLGIEEIRSLEVRCGDEIIYQGGPAAVHEFSLPTANGALQEVTLI